MEEFLSQIWDVLSYVFGGIGRGDRAGHHQPVRLLQRPIPEEAPADDRRHQRLGAEVPGDDRRRAARADGQVPQAAGRRRNARRPAGRGVCRLPRGRPPRAGHAPLRRAVDGRHGAPSRQHRRNGHRRRQDAGGHAAGLSERPGGQGRPRGHGQRLPRPPRHGMDGPALHVAGAHRRHDPEQHGDGRSAEGLRLRHHLRHEQRVRLRLSPRQHASGGQGRQPLRRSTISSRKGRCTTPSSTKWTTS